MTRSDGRSIDSIRDLAVNPFYLSTIPHSVFITIGETRVICCATLEKSLPPWLKGQGRGWVTAEYGMLPKSSPDRIKRERKNVSGRTQEIQRLIGRSLRASVDLKKLGERQIMVDCDVLQADGGTRTASITGGFVALSLLIHDLLFKGELKENPITQNVCAVSAGMIDGKPCIDLDYNEDSTAEVDMNIVMASSLNLIELQGTAEGKTFSRDDLSSLIDLAEKVVPNMVEVQNKAIGEWVERRRKDCGPH